MINEYCIYGGVILEESARKNDLSFGSMLTRVLSSMIVLAIAAFLTPFFSIKGLAPLFTAALVIGIIDYLIERITGFDATPFGRGLTGFIVAAFVIYITGYFVQGVEVNIFGALSAALVIGIINALIPGKIF